VWKGKDTSATVSFHLAHEHMHQWQQVVCSDVRELKCNVAGERRWSMPSAKTLEGDDNNVVLFFDVRELKCNDDPSVYLFLPKQVKWKHVCYRWEGRFYIRTNCMGYWPTKSLREAHGQNQHCLGLYLRVYRTRLQVSHEWYKGRPRHRSEFSALLHACTTIMHSSPNFRMLFY